MRPLRSNAGFLVAQQFLHIKMRGRVLKDSRPRLQGARGKRGLLTSAHCPAAAGCGLGARRISSTQVPHGWRIGIDIQQEVERRGEISLPVMIYVYSPLKYLASKLNMFKLKLLWDVDFREAAFIEYAKRAAARITDLTRQMDAVELKKRTSPIGFKQISYDMIGSATDKRMLLMRFEPEHFRRAYPLKVKLLRHYDHKYAFIDMLFVALRRTNDFDSLSEIRDVADTIETMKYRPIKPHGQERAVYPVIFAEIFVRFRRDYSTTPIHISSRNNDWLISSYKILKFDLLNDHPEFRTPERRESTLLRQYGEPY